MSSVAVASAVSNADSCVVSAGVTEYGLDICLTKTFSHGLADSHFW